MRGVTEAMDDAKLSSCLRTPQPSRIGRHRCFMVSLCIALGATGCGEGPQAGPGEPPSFEQWDSAGIQVSETSGIALEQTVPWDVDSVPDLELGGVDGSGPTQFYRIGGIVGLSDDRLVVVDGDSRELRWFDGAGDHLLTMGGRGEGPGEFENPRFIPQHRGDSLLILDPRFRRFTWIAKDGSGFRLQDPPDNRELIVGSASGAHGSRILFRTQSAECLLENICESPVVVRWVDLSEGVSKTIGGFSRWSARLTSLEGVPYFIGGPFDPVGVTAVDAEGPVIERAPDFEFRRFNASGELTSIFRIDTPIRDADGEALERATREYDGLFAPSSVRGAFDDMDLPAALPAFQSLVVDALGWYWAERFRLSESDPSTWIVFDPEGRAHGTIQMPDGLEVHEIGEDYILGRWADDLDVESVRRYGLHR